MSRRTGERLVWGFLAVAGVLIFGQSRFTGAAEIVMLYAGLGFASAAFALAFTEWRSRE